MIKQLAVLAVAISTPAFADRPHDVTATIHTGDRDRTYRVHLPGAVDGRDPSPAGSAAEGRRGSIDGRAHPLPLVIAFHGGTGLGVNMEIMTRFDATSNQHGFIVVYPDGIGRNWGDGRGTTEPEKQGVDDVAFVAALIDRLSRDYPIDATRIYATGISNGGFMAEKLACELADKIAAIAPVAATIASDEVAKCKPSRPVSVIDIHGTDDPLVPFAGGEVHGGAGGRIRSVADTIAMWVGRDGCNAKPVRSELPDRDPNDGTRVHRDVYGGCKAGTSIELYTVDKGGHTWPGGGKLPEKIVGITSQDFDASEAIWTFFSHQQLPTTK